MVFEGNEKDLRVRDLVEVPDIRTVVQLADLKDPRLSRMLLESFVLTQEASENLRAVLASLARGEGRGILLKGHFGSGKSHFLSLLSMLLKAPDAWKAVLDQDAGLKGFEENLAQRRLLAVEISLVQHRAAEFLEDIVGRAVSEAIGEDLFAGTESRHAGYQRLKGRLQDKGLDGLVLLVDELSEFLRSKADARQFNEDVRFLQFLGEEGRGFPLWVVATLQEWIEETGEIHQDTFNKIKDRYRVRLGLGRAHIEELVSERLIRHKPGADEHIGRLFEELKGFFPTFPVVRDRFARLYPVHPATSVLLDRLRMLFSEHRGIVDFIHFRLKGDPERRIPSWLDRPARDLLTPDHIFDHFLDRIRERSETQLYVARVYESHAELIPSLFQDPDQQRVALAAVKLLILFSVSPVKSRYTVRHMAEMILFPITPLEAEINYRFLLDILERLAGEGSYIRVERKEDPLENLYLVDLKTDVVAVMRGRIRHAAAQLFPEDQRLFSRLARLVDTPQLPLAAWVEKGRQPLGVSWQHTRRMGILLVRQLDEVKAEELDALAQQSAWSEEDFFLFIGTPHGHERQLLHLRDTLLPHVRARHGGMFLFWLPESMEAHQEQLREVLAALLLRETLDREASEQNRQAAAFLEGYLEREKSGVSEAFSQSYFNGRLFWDEGQEELSRLGLLSPEKFLAEFVPPLLKRRFPRHSRIQPFMDALAPTILLDLLRDFLVSGVLPAEGPARHGLREVLEGLLRPMGLVRKKGRGYELEVNPRQSELARLFLEEMAQRPSMPLEEIYWRFRKGDYGLMRPHFEILVLALIFSGNLVAFKGASRKSAEELARTGLKGVSTLGRGEILSEEFRQAIGQHPLVPRKFKDVPLTLALQEELWAALKSAKGHALEDLKTLRSRIKWAMSFVAFRKFPWDGVLEAIETAVLQWEELKVSLSSREGLERFLAAARREPFLADKVRRIGETEGFLQQVERALFAYQYLMHPKLQVPSEPAYDELREAHELTLRCFQEPSAGVSALAMEEIFSTFQRFREGYAAAYAAEHQQAKSGGVFEVYEQLSRSRRYGLLKRLDQLSMISVEHDRRSVDQRLSGVLLQRCSRSPLDLLQTEAVCSCGFQLGEKLSFPPIKDLEGAVDRGISESLSALQQRSVQEKILPYLEGLRLVGKTGEAEEVREVLKLSPEAAGVVENLEQHLTPGVIRHINEAFRGKVIVVRRDLDRLYRSLVHRKYTLAQTRRILREWLSEEELSEETYLHFQGRGSESDPDLTVTRLEELLEKRFPALTAIWQEIGRENLSRALVTVFWAAQYGLSGRQIVALLPPLERGSDQDNALLLKQIEELGGILRSERPEDLEHLIRDFETEGALLKALWAALTERSPQEVFSREKMLVPVLKEAFERVFLDRLQSSAGNAEAPEPEYGGETPGGRGRLQEVKAAMSEALELLGSLREAARSVRKAVAAERDGVASWEGFYTRHLGRLPWHREQLAELLQRCGVAPPAELEKEGRLLSQSIREVGEQFKRYYLPSLTRWEAGESGGPLTIADIPSLLARKRGGPEHRALRYVLMDGMRWDLWEHVKRGFFGRFSNLFHVAREGLLWSNRPTSTAEQLRRLEEAFAAAGKRPDDPDLLWKLSGVDEKVHSEKGPLTHLFSNVVSYLELEWLRRLTELPSRTLLIVFSDHGFVENPTFDPTDKYALPRYIHGGDTPFEVIVPWAWVVRL